MYALYAVEDGSQELLEIESAGSEEELKDIQAKFAESLMEDFLYHEEHDEN